MNTQLLLRGRRVIERSILQVIAFLAFAALNLFMYRNGVSWNADFPKSPMSAAIVYGPLVLALLCVLCAAAAGANGIGVYRAIRKFHSEERPND